MITHTVCCNCGHKYEIDGLEDDKVIEVTCPNCKTKKGICNMKVGNSLSVDETFSSILLKS